MINNLVSTVVRMYEWVKCRFQHKLEHLSKQELKDSIIRGGIPLLVIFVGWEIIEDVLFPVAFLWLGKNVHPIFYGAIPVSWLLCLHWLMVPILWGAWMKLRNGSQKF